VSPGARRLLVGGLALVLFAATVLGQGIELPRDVPPFNQAYTDGPDAWGDCALGTEGCPDQVCTTGCLTTAFASVLAYYGVELSVAPEESCTGRARSGMNPGILNDWLRANGAYGRCVQDPVGNCCLVWGRLPDGVELTFHVNRSDVGLNPVASVVIDHALRQGRPIVAGVHWGASCHGDTGQTEDCHWVVLTGKTADTYSIIDPYNADPASPYGIRTTLDAGVHGAYVIDRFVVVEYSSTASTAAQASQSAGEAEPERPSEPSALVLLAALALVAALVLLVTATGNEAAP